MRAGIVILAESRWSEARRRWRLAEQYGFDTAWTYDHIGWRELVDGPWFDAVPTLTAAATVTSAIQLGTLVASPNFRHPVPFAREVTALDDISDGRMVVGIGAGAPSLDVTVLNSPELTARQRFDRFAEFTELLDAVLTGDCTTWRGGYYQAIAARSHPGCVQRPRAPFVIAANGPRGFRLAARTCTAPGDGWVTTGTTREDSASWWRSVAECARRFEDALHAEGRPATDDDATGGVRRLLNLDANPVYSLSSVECFADGVGRAAELGFTDVITHWPRPSSWYAGDESVLDKVAADVLPTLAG